MFSVDSDCDNIGEVNKDKRTIDVHVREVATCCMVIVYTLQKACQCLAVGRDSHLVCNVFMHIYSDL